MNCASSAVRFVPRGLSLEVSMASVVNYNWNETATGLSKLFQLLVSP